jgi:HAD superfamily hydrolase (TIGR01509 family)
VKAILFDMDGVIVDSEPLHERACAEVLREIGYGGNGAWRYADYIGQSDREMWAAFLAEHRPRQAMTELLSLKRRRFVEILRREKPLFPGIPELMAKLAARFSLGLASGSEREVVEEVLRIGDLGRFFSAVVTDSEIERGKPLPDIFLRTAGLLGVAPRDCWVVEDSKPGIAAGLAAGMKVVAIANTHSRAELENAPIVVQTLGELERLLLP